MKKMKMRASGRSESLERSAALEMEGAAAAGDQAALAGGAQRQQQQPEAKQQRPQRYKKFSLNYLFASANRDREHLLQQEQTQASSGSSTPHSFGTPQARHKLSAVMARRSAQSAAKGRVPRAGSNPDLIARATLPFQKLQEAGDEGATPAAVSGSTLKQRSSFSDRVTRNVSADPQDLEPAHKCITYRSAAGGEATVIPLPDPAPTGFIAFGAAADASSRQRKKSTSAATAAHRNTLDSSEVPNPSSKKRSSEASVASSCSDNSRRQSSSEAASSFAKALPSGSTGAPALAAASGRKSLPQMEQTLRLQRQVDDVSQLMHANVARVMERSGRLEELERCSTSLEQSGRAFEERALNLLSAQKRTTRRVCPRALYVGLCAGSVLLLFGLVLSLLLSGPRTASASSRSFAPPTAASAQPSAPSPAAAGPTFGPVTNMLPTNDGSGTNWEEANGDAGSDPGSSAAGSNSGATELPVHLHKRSLRGIWLANKMRSRTLQRERAQANAN